MVRKTGLTRVRDVVDRVNRDLFMSPPMPPGVFKRRRVTQRNAPPEVRSRVVTKLVGAIEEVERLAKASGRRTPKGGGGISPKERWYQLMGYLTQVLDGVLKNLDLETVREKMDQMEAALDELQRTAPTAG